MVMEVGNDGNRGSVDDNPFREAIEVINALAEEGEFEFEEAERMAQQEQAFEDQQRRTTTLAPENPLPRQRVTHSFGLHSLRHPRVAEAQNHGLRMTNGDADDEEEEDGGGGEDDDDDDDDASSGGDSVILLPRGISSPRKQIERKEEEEEKEREGKGDVLERRDDEEEKENSENGATVEVRRVNAVPQAPNNATSNMK